MRKKSPRPCRTFSCQGRKLRLSSAVPPVIRTVRTHSLFRVGRARSRSIRLTPGNASKLMSRYSAYARLRLRGKSGPFASGSRGGHSSGHRRKACSLRAFLSGGLGPEYFIPSWNQWLDTIVTYSKPERRDMSTFPVVGQSTPERRMNMIFHAYFLSGVAIGAI
jgi:hypothetical protein